MVVCMKTQHSGVSRAVFFMHTCGGALTMAYSLKLLDIGKMY